MSDEQDDAQKTEEPTPKKIQDARKKGQVAMSREINNWVMLFVGTVVMGSLATYVLGRLKDFMRGYVEHAAEFPSVPGGLHIVMGDAYFEVMKILAFPLILFMLAAILAPLLQVGPLFAPEAIKPDLGKISPLKGFKRLFSSRSLVEFAKGVGKLAIIGVVGVIILYPYYDKAEHLVGMPIPLLIDELMGLIMRLLVGILVVLLVIAVADLTYQRYQNYKQLRMTKQEVKDEYKQTEGDPHVKGRLRQLRAERSRQRMMQAVPTADVVITNPTHFSVALKYDSDAMEAPRCVAKGTDDLALRIREVAKEHDIVVYEAPPLARLLFDTVEVDEFIPPDLYKAVAEVISYVFKTKGRTH